MGFFNAWQQLEALDVTPSEAMLMTGDCPPSPQRSIVGCQVVVALIDTGFNFQHEDIQGHRFFFGKLRSLGGLELGIRIRIYQIST